MSITFSIAGIIVLALTATSGLLLILLDHNKKVVWLFRISFLLLMIWFLISFNF